MCAQNGLKKLIETYRNNSIISLTLNYFHVIITNHVDQVYNETIFHKDGLTSMYTKELVDELNTLWTQEKIKVILDLITFLTNDKSASNNVKSLENIMENNDKETFGVLDR
jgi:predicted metallopeptidase